MTHLCIFMIYSPKIRIGPRLGCIVHKKTGKQKHRQMRLVSMLIFRPCEGIAEITLNNDFLKDAILRDM